MTNQEINVRNRERRLEDLERRLGELRASRELQRNARKGFTYLSLVALLVIGITATFKLNDLLIPLTLILLTALGLAAAATPWGIDTEIQSVVNETDLTRSSELSIEERAERLFRYHQFELKRYYDQALGQSGWIFRAGLLCIVIGFALIAGTGYFLISNSTGKNLSEQIVIASLGAGGSILANFVGAIYLRMFSETIKSLTEFHNRLVATHRLHFGNFLAAKINDTVLREKTLAGIALNTSHQPKQTEGDDS
jgi:hypothetical protein